MLDVSMEQLEIDIVSAVLVDDMSIEETNDDILKI